MLPCTRYAITDISKFNILTACSYPIPYTVPSKPATPVHSLMTVSMPRSIARSWWRLPSISVLAVRCFPPKRCRLCRGVALRPANRLQSFPRSLPGLPPSDTRCAWARRSPAESLPPTSTLHCLHTRASAREQSHRSRTSPAHSCSVRTGLHSRDHKASFVDADLDPLLRKSQIARITQHHRHQLVVHSKKHQAYALIAD